jgi:23S rRNA pseudouridine1911/1915/1917 synthase
MVFPGSEPLEPRIIYEDSRLVAVLKPPRFHCAPGLGGGGLCAWVFERFPESRRIGSAQGRAGRPAEEGGLLHRLDFETSGIVLFARDSEAFDSLLLQQASGGFVKEYIALSSASREPKPEGSVPREAVPDGIDPVLWSDARKRSDARSLASLLGGGGPWLISSSFRPFGPKGSRVACILSETDTRAIGKPIYRSEAIECEESGEDAVLQIRVRLARGFRHQVRAHLAWIGLPILGDALYGGLPDERLRLYAETLIFAHPSTGLALSLSAGYRSGGGVAFRP